MFDQVEGVINVLGTSHCELEVRENWGIRVVVLDENGKEKVVWGRELKRCEGNKHATDNPFSARKHHIENRRLLKGDPSPLYVILIRTLNQTPLSPTKVSGTVPWWRIHTSKKGVKLRHQSVST